MSLTQQTHEIADLVKKTGDVELHRKILRLEEEIIELARRALKLEQENDQLRSNLKKRDNLSFESPFFIESGTKQKCCPQCWQRDQRVVFVVGGGHAEREQLFDCPTCHRTYRWDGRHWNVFGGEDENSRG